MEESRDSKHSIVWMGGVPGLSLWVRNFSPCFGTQNTEEGHGQNVRRCGAGTRDVRGRGRTDEGSRAPSPSLFLAILFSPNVPWRPRWFAVVCTAHARSSTGRRCTRVLTHTCARNSSLSPWPRVCSCKLDAREGRIASPPGQINICLWFHDEPEARCASGCLSPSRGS